jgi:anaerobic magnesium-protoporphyrin IX monomethyl ester cyclase
MKLLLINTPINRHDILGNFAPIYKDLKMIPTGIAYLAAYARNEGVEVKILDQYAECLPLKDVYRRVAEFSPDLIGYSATTPNYYAAIDLVRSVKREFPAIPTVLGGYHPSVLAEQTLAEPAVDFVIRDEGEAALVRLCDALDRGRKDFSSINGLS